MVGVMNVLRMTECLYICAIATEVPTQYSIYTLCAAADGSTMRGRGNLPGPRTVSCWCGGRTQVRLKIELWSCVLCIPHNQVSAS